MFEFRTHIWNHYDEKWFNVYDDEDKDIKKNVIYGFGLFKTKNEEIKSVCVKIVDFNPWLYIELPLKINNTTKDYNKKEIEYEILKFFKSRLYKYNEDIKEMKLTWLKKLYYANYTINTETKELNENKFPYIRLECYSHEVRKQIMGNLKKKYKTKGYEYKYGDISFNIHETDASPLLQFVSKQLINIGGWNRINGIRNKDFHIIEQDNKITQYDYEITTSYKNIIGIEKTEWINPIVLSFDIECYSSIQSSMPKAKRPQDCVFQIGCVVTDHNLEKKKYILCFANSQNKPLNFDEETEIINFNSEENLIIGFTNFIHKCKANVLIGWNIFGFDIKYLYKRMLLYYSQSMDAFLHQGVLLDRRGEYKKIEWSSSAARARKYKIIDASGIIYIDLMNEVMRNVAFKFDSYTLNNVSQELIGDEKDDLSAKQMFKLFEKGDEKSLSIIAKYCVQDCDLVARIYDKLKTMHQLSVMGTVCRVNILDLGTRGQQLKVYSQIYDFCVNNNRVVEKDVYKVKEGEMYTGGHVFEPKPGFYENVFPFDFASLYPSIMIAYNICFSTYVIDDNIPDDLCHIIEWEEHTNCIHDISKKKKNTSTKNKSKVICGCFKYRFLKYPIGVLPSKLISLLQERKNVRNKMKPLESKLKDIKNKIINVSEKEKFDIETDLTVLDAQQLALKVSCNSAYGALGVSKGFLPFMVGAMCVTAKGRESIKLAAKVLNDKFNASLVYGDTDSCMVQFKHLSKPQELWDNAVKVQDGFKEYFPPPMGFEFEGMNYSKYLIFTKKRYIIVYCDRDGNLNDKMKKRGVLSVRRTYCKFTRNLFDEMTFMTLMKSHSIDEIIYIIINKILSLCQRNVNIKDLITTASLGNIESYKLKKLNLDPKKRDLQLKKKKVNNEHDYQLSCLPAHVKLAEKMKNRGCIVDTGSRIPFIYLSDPISNLKINKGDRIEDPDYFLKHKTILRIDYLCYVHQLINAFDEFSLVAWNKKGKMFSKLYKQMLNKYKVNLQIKKIFYPKFINESDNGIQKYYKTQT